MDKPLSIKLIETIPKDIFIIWWSTAIKKQINLFRKPKDIDIMMSFKDFSNYIMTRKEEEFELVSSKYESESIFTLKFKDKSCIDVMISPIELYRSKSSTKIWDYYYLSLMEIVRFKLNLIQNDLDKNLNRKNKHIKDILFIHDSWDMYK